MRGLIVQALSGCLLCASLVAAQSPAANATLIPSSSSLEARAATSSVPGSGLFICEGFARSPDSWYITSAQLRLILAGQTIRTTTFTAGYLGDTFTISELLQPASVDRVLTCDITVTVENCGECGSGGDSDSLTLPAETACVSTSNASDMSVPRNARIQAATTQQNCSGRTTQVKAWIDGLVFDCSGDTTPLQNCIMENANGNAVTTASDNGNNCGTWNGQSDHKYNEGGPFVDIGHRTTTLNAGSCSDIVADNARNAGVVDDALTAAVRCQGLILVAVERGASYRMTSVAGGVSFDMDGDGAAEQVAWTERGAEVALLAIDRDGDGRITSGKELFGSQSAPGAANGFEALQKAAMETNGGILRGSVSEDDPLFRQLLLWTDRNHDGQSDETELRAASRVVSEIGLGYHMAKRADRNGNMFRSQGWVHVRSKAGRNRSESMADNQARTRPVWDVCLATP